MVFHRKFGRGMLTGLATLALLGTSALALAGQPPKPDPFSLLQNEGKIHEGNIEGIHVLVSDEQSHGRISILESNWQPDFKVPLHYHKYHAEVFIVVKGHLNWTINGETHVIGPGEAVYIPPLTEHAVTVAGGKPAEVIFMQLPGGYEIGSDYGASVKPGAKPVSPQLKKLINAVSDFNLVNPNKY